MSIVKYHESHYVAVLDRYANQAIQLKARKSQEAMEAYKEDSLLLITTKLIPNYSKV